MDSGVINSRCSCCPYEIHLGLDFVPYCEALLSPHYTRQRDEIERNGLRSPPEHRKHLQNGNHVHSKTFPWYCDNESKRQRRISSDEWDSRNQCSMFSPSSEDVFQSTPSDSSFTDAIVKFEEVLRELQQARRCKYGVPRELYIKTDLPDSLRTQSPPTSPAASVDSSATMNRAVLSQIRDQMALSLQRMRELEDQTREVPILRQKLILAREQNKRLLQKLNNEYNEDYICSSRLKELERSGFITPPLFRRKCVLRTDSDSDADETELPMFESFGGAQSMVSSKNIDLQALDGKRDVNLQTSYTNLGLRSAGTNTDTLPLLNCKDAFATASLNNGRSPRLSSVLVNSYGVQPKASLNQRSVGVSTNFAPSLPRRNALVMTEFKLNDVLSDRGVPEKKPIVVCRGLDPITWYKMDEAVQAVSKQKSKSTKTDDKILIDTGTDYDKVLNASYTDTKSSQTQRRSFENKAVQAVGKCVYCEVKQTETIGVGEGTATVRDVSCITDDTSKIFLSDNRKIDSCGVGEKSTDIATKQVKGVLKDKTPSPTMGSKIPRLAHSVSVESGKIESQKRIIIEEGKNEILVYRNPNLSHNGKHRSHFPNMITGQQQVPGLRLLDEVRKISESDSDESNSSDEGTYELDTSTVSPSAPKKRIEPSKELRAALKVLNDSLLKPERGNKPATTKSLQIIEKEWFRIAGQKDSIYSTVEDYLDCFETYSKHLLNCVVNLTDGNGNTAMHYAISHSSFDIVAVLLESKVCDVNKQNKAGYTCVMLVSLARITNETQKEVIRRLFQLGDVNIRAKQNGQTALMLASSHGQFITCKLLIEAGAALNVQDNDGSTALMCAAEHGHADVVRLLLSHPDCDPNIIDNDGSTALSVAMENGHKDIGLMLYASTNMLSRGSSPYASLRRSQSKAAASSLKRTGSFTSRTPTASKSYQLASSPPPPTQRSRHSSAASNTSQASKKNFY